MHAGAAVRGPSPRTVVAVTGDPEFRRAIEEIFAPPCYTLTALDSTAEVVPYLAQTAVDAVLVDLDSLEGPPEQTLDRVKELRRVQHDVVLLTATISGERGLRQKAFRVGVDEFFRVPADLEVLRPLVEHAIERRSAEIDSRRGGQEIDGIERFCDLLGRSEAMRRVYDAILRVAESATSVVIRGESGTGKELVARSIVAMGPRRNKPFVSLNCAALPESLMEAELFGHEKGAFTGAVAARPGHIELAHGGTLFLDEIATLTMHLQSKLLRVLEDRAVTRLGGSVAKKIDFRLLTATNENLEEMAKRGRFREDLYYRIHVVPIFLPPLRDREGDIAILADHFVRQYCTANNVPMKRMELDALEVLEEYNWPGNVRELENIIQRLVLMVEGPVIGVKHLPQQILYKSTAKHEALLIPEEGIDFDVEMERIESAYVQAALRRAGGKKTAAAELLKVNAQKMKYLCRKHRITGI